MHCLIKNKKEELVYLIAFICTVVVSMVLFVYWGNGTYLCPNTIEFTPILIKQQAL